MPIQKSLETFFGVGGNTSSRLLARFNIHPTCRVGELANKQVLDLTAVLSDMKIENDLRREVLNDIKRLKETGTYRGRRHALGLPVRGQRTRTQVGFPLLALLGRLLGAGDCDLPWVVGVPSLSVSREMRTLILENIG
jgi:small subunit ribosomal protein S13